MNIKLTPGRVGFAAVAAAIAFSSIWFAACSCGCASTTGVVVRSDPRLVLAAAPLDAQVVQDQQEMTWADYHPIPGKDWADPAPVPQRVLRIALVAVDFPDQPFVITLPKGSDPFGNPQVDPVPREQVPRFYADFYNKPGALNHGRTINGYWMEQSRGKIGIPPLDTHGPYRMPKKFFQYGLNEWGQQGGCPTGYVCDGELEADADALWRADAGKDIAAKYDIVLRIYAGYDETSIWQEFGEMKFQSPDSIPPEWGNPDASKPRWVASRYVSWTSWKAGQMQWGLSSMRQGENSGTITHEIAHYAFATGDNNNNPYAKPYRRVGSGPWDIMDRGCFNGPGGPHRRWVVPAAEGAAMPAGFMLRNRVYLAPLGLWLTLDAGQFASVEINLESGVVRLGLAKASAFTRTARLRIEHPARWLGTKIYSPPAGFKNERGAYVVPLRAGITWIELHGKGER